MTRIHLFERFFYEHIDEVVHFDAKAFAARHLDMRALLVFFRKLKPEFDAGAR